MELEEKMSRELEQQRAQQSALLKEKLAQRKKERMRKLKEQQELEKAKVNPTFVVIGTSKFGLQLNKFEHTMDKCKICSTRFSPNVFELSQHL